MERLLTLCPRQRCTGPQALASSYFTGDMHLLVFPGGSQEWVGERGKARFVMGELGGDVLQWLRDDPYWSLDHKLSWNAPNGTKNPADRKRTKVESADTKGSPFEGKPAPGGVKIQVAGNCGATDRAMINGLKTTKPLPAERATHWIRAFREANAARLRCLHEALVCKLRELPEEDLGANGKEFLDFQAGFEDWWQVGHRAVSEARPRPRRGGAL